MDNSFNKQMDNVKMLLDMTQEELDAYRKSVIKYE